VNIGVHKTGEAEAFIPAVGSSGSGKNRGRFSYAGATMSANAGRSWCLLPAILGWAWLRFAF
jgi:hypothetical protein